MLVVKFHMRPIAFENARMVPGKLPSAEHTRGFSSQKARAAAALKDISFAIARLFAAPLLIEKVGNPFAFRGEG